MLTDFRIDQFSKMALEPLVGALLVSPHQSRVPGHIGREDCREPAFDASWPGGLHGALLLSGILH
jgi:hypothetical protein